MSASTREARERTQNWPRMRPRFIVELDCGVDHVMDALRESAAKDAQPVEANFSERHGVLSMPEEEREFWSTHLSLTIEDAGTATDGTSHPTRVLGVFSPQPEIWTAYVFAIGTLSVIAVFGTMWAVVQISMGHWPWALLAPLIAILVGGLVYTSTLVGQGLALGEMYELRRHLDDRLSAAEARGRQTPSTAQESAQL